MLATFWLLLLLIMVLFVESCVLLLLPMIPVSPKVGVTVVLLLLDCSLVVNCWLVSVAVVLFSGSVVELFLLLLDGVDFCNALISSCWAL